MTDQLTADDLKVLRARFAFEDHEFLKGYVYITEEAITNRLEDADPSWKFEIVSIFNSGDQVVVTARMTVKGVSRDGVGMQKILEKAGEAEKGAATDAMKRCARLFGVGRYLLGAPSGEDAFKKWLNGNAQPSNVRTMLPGGDLRDKTAAAAFITFWRGKSLSDNDVLAALGVSKLSEYTQGVDAANVAVNLWLSQKLSQDSA